jgi:hypothetical protein
VPDRIIYLVQKVTPAMSESELEFVDDAALNKLLAEGWETSTVMPDRKVSVGSKTVVADRVMLKLAGENRGLALADDQRAPHRGGMVTVRDDFGRAVQVPADQAMANMLAEVKQSLQRTGEASHLGASQNHNLPGLTIVSGQMVSKALDIGSLAANRGDPVESNPFSPSSEAGQQWLAGYRMRQRSQGQQVQVSGDAADAAYRAGRQTALQYDPDDQVFCPYPAGSPLRDHWVKGFRDGGGRVEG